MSYVVSKIIFCFTVNFTYSVIIWQHRYIFLEFCCEFSGSSSWAFSSLSDIKSELLSWIEYSPSEEYTSLICFFLLFFWIGNREELLRYDFFYTFLLFYETFFLLSSLFFSFSAISFSIRSLLDAEVSNFDSFAFPYFR